MSVLKNATIRVTKDPVKQSNIAKLTAGAIVLSFASLFAIAPAMAAGQQHVQQSTQQQNQGLAGKVLEIKTVQQNQRVKTAQNSTYNRLSSNARTATRSATSSLFESALGKSQASRDISRIAGSLTAGSVQDAIQERRRAQTHRVNVSLAVLVNGRVEPMVIQMPKDNVNFKKGENVLLYPDGQGGTNIIPLGKNTRGYK